VTVGLSPILQGHRVLVVYDEVLGQDRGGQLRSLPLLRALGLERFTYNFAWNRYGYAFCEYTYVHLDASSVYDRIEAPLCQVVDQGTEEMSEHDVTLRLLGSEAFAPASPLVLVTAPNFKLRGVTELKSLAEARGYPILNYREELLGRPDVWAGLDVDPGELTRELLDATANFALLRAASRLYRLTGQRARSVAELFAWPPDVLRQIGLWRLVEQIDETILADPARTQSYMLDCLRPWIEYGSRTRVKDRLIEHLQHRSENGSSPRPRQTQHVGERKLHPRQASE
jgi:hypothetical protein